MFITPIDAARRIDRNPETVRRWCRDYEGSFAIRLGGCWKVIEEALEQVRNGKRLASLTRHNTV